MTSLNRDRVVSNFQKMQDLQSKTFTLGSIFRDGAESALKIYFSMETNMYGFPMENQAFRKSMGVVRQTDSQKILSEYTSVWRPTCVDFLSKMHVSELIWELPDLIWHLLEAKVNVLDERSENFKKK